MSSRKEQRRQHYLANRERLLAVSREWYAKNPEKARAYRVANREKERARSRKWAAAHPEEVRAKDRVWQAANKEKVRVWHRAEKYGLTADAFDAMRAAQQNKCAICGKEFDREPHVDHDHITGKVRGLLCRKCNSMLGMAGDSRATLLAGADYIGKNV
jgi:DNA-directed RNA polymerase subunit RPC12/RpoP